MRVLAIDAATRTGWAARLDYGTTESGVEDFSKRRGESNGMLFLRFNRWLALMCDTWHFEVLAFEQAHHRGGAPTEIGVGLATRIMEAAAARGIEHVSVHTATIKKFATGKGNAEKSEMVKAANRMPRSATSRPVITDDNEADAVCLLNYVIKEIVGEGAGSCNAQNAESQPGSSKPAMATPE